jgi:hypothetical protein
MCNKAGGIGNIGCNAARDGIAPLSASVHGNVCDEAGSIGIIGCNATKDGIVPLSARAHGNVCNKAGGVGNINCNTDGGIRRVGLLFCSSENNSLNKVSPPNVRSPKKSVLKRKFSSQSNGGTVIQPPLSTRLPPALRTICSIIMPNLSLRYRGVYGSFFGPAFTFAAKSLQHTANQLQQWAREPDLGVKSFADSILLTSWRICLPYHGVLLDRAHNPCNGFVFGAVSCTGNCSSGKHCSHCASKINMAIKV